MKAITDLRFSNGSEIRFNTVEPADKLESLNHATRIECEHCHREFPPEEMDGFYCVTCITENEAEWIRSYSADYERKEANED